jgi:hypothetical protein
MKYRIDTQGLQGPADIGVGVVGRLLALCSGVSIGSLVYWWPLWPSGDSSGEGYYLKAEDGGEDLVICNQVPVIFSAILNCTLSCYRLLKLRMRPSLSPTR